MNKPRILVIDDEAQIRKLLEITLHANDYEVSHAESGKEGIAFVASHPPDLILLDLGLPDMNGQDLLTDIRQWYTRPVIILSVLNSETDIVNALDNGASDYLVKPFRTGELLARIRSALRSKMTEASEPFLDCGTYTIDLIGRQVKKNEQLLKLTATEYNLLSLLATNHGKVLTHQYLLRQIWGPTYSDQSQYLRVFIAQIRKKTEDNPDKPRHIITEQGVGYRFVLKD